VAEPRERGDEASFMLDHAQLAKVGSESRALAEFAAILPSRSTPT